ncbi:MAG TPA: FAD:protein FMN transferase [Cyclobacteriaceae bacterium]
MNNRARNILYTIILLASVYVVYTIRKKPDEPRIAFGGRTMGTTYSIIYYDKKGRDFQKAVDSVLVVFNQSLNTYLPDSEISRFNTGTSFRFNLPFFYPVLKRSKEIYESSGGAFDPTVMPLVNAWGFGPAEPLHPDSVQVDSLLEFVGMDKIFFNEDSVWKEDPRVQLDFSAIAKGYGVDVVADFLKDKGIRNLFVEIGGEVVTAGTNIGEQRPWQVGILDPNSTIDVQSYIAYAQLKDIALATSGNYFNFRVEDGKKFSHTIDPATGYPVQRTILSASVFAENCMTADAWATAFMVMGEERARQILDARDDINAFLTFSQDDGSIGTFATGGLRDILKLNRKQQP